MKIVQAGALAALVFGLGLSTVSQAQAEPMMRHHNRMMMRHNMMKHDHMMHHRMMRHRMMRHRMMHNM